ncbi:MAG: agmatine deiminase family protein [Bdellovibrionales bacterium]|nr:agmatine deiminase family protein [Bdellovibrionales bacterium]
MSIVPNKASFQKYFQYFVFFLFVVSFEIVYAQVESDNLVYAMVPHEYHGDAFHFKRIALLASAFESNDDGKLIVIIPNEHKRKDLLSFAKKNGFHKNIIIYVCNGKCSLTHHYIRDGATGWKYQNDVSYILGNQRFEEVSAMIGLAKELGQCNPIDIEWLSDAIPGGNLVSNGQDLCVVNPRHLKQYRCPSPDPYLRQYWDRKIGLTIPSSKVIKIDNAPSIETEPTSQKNEKSSSPTPRNDVDEMKQMSETEMLDQYFINLNKNDMDRRSYPPMNETLGCKKIIPGACHLLITPNDHVDRYVGFLSEFVAIVPTHEKKEGNPEGCFNDYYQRVFDLMAAQLEKEKIHVIRIPVGLDCIQKELKLPILTEINSLKDLTAKKGEHFSTVSRTYANIEVTKHAYLIPSYTHSLIAERTGEDLFPASDEYRAALETYNQKAVTLIQNAIDEGYLPEKKIISVPVLYEETIGGGSLRCRTSNVPGIIQKCKRKPFGNQKTKE